MNEAIKKCKEVITENDMKILIDIKNKIEKQIDIVKTNNLGGDNGDKNSLKDIEFGIEIINLFNEIVN